MKFPETKTRSPFYKMLSPLVEKAPMVPFISSFLRRRPGRALFAQMGRGARAQGPGRGAGACGEGGPAGSGGGRGAGRGVLRPDEWTGIVPSRGPGVWAASVWRKGGFPRPGSVRRPRPAKPAGYRAAPTFPAALPPPPALAVLLCPLPKGGGHPTRCQAQAGSTGGSIPHLPRPNPTVPPPSAPTQPASPGLGDQAPPAT